MIVRALIEAVQDCPCLKNVGRSEERPRLVARKRERPERESACTSALGIRSGREKRTMKKVITRNGKQKTESLRRRTMPSMQRNALMIPRNTLIWTNWFIWEFSCNWMSLVRLFPPIVV